MNGNNGGTATSIAAKILSPVTTWNFDTSDVAGQAVPAGAIPGPDPSTGSGTALDVGMNAYTGPDASNVTAATGSSDTSASNQVWKIIGNNGWSSGAAVATQGAQFTGINSTQYTNVGVTFDLNVTAQGEGNLAVEYTTDNGASWHVANALSVGADTGISIVNNGSGNDANSVNGSYFHVTGGAGWYNRLTADLTGITGINGIELVNASTGTSCVNATGAPLNNTSGNWQFDEVDLGGIATASAPPAISAQPTAQNVAAGQTATFFANATGTPVPQVQWQVNSGSGYTPIAGATSTVFTVTASSANNNDLYQAVFSNGVGSTATSNGVALTVPLCGAGNHIDG